MHPKDMKRWQAYIHARVKVDPVTGCWEWQLHRFPDDYGCTHAAHGCGRYAHRLAYTAFKGPIPDGMQVRHQCHNNPCCNPKHLLIGTDQDNKDDAKRDGRKFGGAVLTVMQVLEIKCLLERKQHTKAQIGKMFGVSDVSICNISTGKTWAHI